MWGGEHMGPLILRFLEELTTKRRNNLRFIGNKEI